MTRPARSNNWALLWGFAVPHNDRVQFSSLQSLSHVSLQPHELQHARPPCPSPTTRVYSNSCPLSWWCHPSISSSVVLFSSCPQSLLPSGSFPMSQLFSSGGQSTGVSASASVLPMNTQDWSPLGWTGWILQFKGLSGILSNSTVQKHQLFGSQLSAILPSSVLTGCPGTIRESNTWRETRCYVTHPQEGGSRFWKKFSTKATA